MNQVAGVPWGLDRTKEKWKYQCFFLSNHFFFFFLLQLFVFALKPVSSQLSDGVIVTQSNFEGLQAIKDGFYDPHGALRSWNDSGSGACLGGWIGIKCVRGQVIAIQLPFKGLGGTISEKIGQLTALRKLNLHHNYIDGEIPSSLGLLPNLRGVHLFNNRLSGSIPPSIGLCPSLQTFDVSHNSLIGTIPADLAKSTKLYRLNLSFNALSGSIPISLTHSPTLAFLALQYNNLSGSVPDTWGGAEKSNSMELRSLTLDHNSISGNIPSSLSKLTKLEELSMSYNQINGTIPDELGTLSSLQILDLSNNAIAGSVPATLSNLSSLTQLSLEGNRLENHIPESINRLEKLSVLDLSRNQFEGDIPASLGNITSLIQLNLSQNDLTGEIPMSIADLPNLSSFDVSFNNLSGAVPSPLSTRFNLSSFVGNLQLCGYSVSTPCPSLPPSLNSPAHSPESSLTPRRHRKFSTRDIILIASGAVLGALLLLCGILFCCLIRKKAAAASKGKNGHRGVVRSAAAGGGEKGTQETATDVEAGGETGGKLVHFEGHLVFTADDLLCATAEIMGKSTYGTAYKATLEDGSQVAVKRLREKIAKTQKEFETEVNVIGKIRHPNLSPLRAYYLGPKGEKLLVFDFMPRGSLAAFLHARGPDSPIDWPTRMNIAMGAARGLSYLHNNENIVHGNLTARNVLLDEQTNAKIADYGLYRLMTTAANANVIATAASIGYRAPELVKTKKVSAKTDVYSLGVIMLELLTGKSPGEELHGVDLPQWVASIVNEEWTNEVFDLELMKEANSGDELLNTLKLALHCVDPSPAARPEAQQVLQQLEEIKPEQQHLSPGDD